MNAQEISVAFAEAFCAADLDRLASLLAPRFSLTGPLFRFSSPEEYLQSLRAGSLEVSSCRILQTTGSERDAAVLYEYEKEGGTVLVAQFSRVTGGLISEIRLVFDTAQVRNSP